ncbi:MAG: hypothetical protein R3F17_09460 [Planctomycetota bacterium]
MSATVYYILHVISLLLLTGATAMAVAAPKPELRKKYLMGTGILSLLVLTGGFGLLARLYNGFPVFVMVKLACWLVLSALAGLAYRKPESKCTWAALGVLAIVVAVLMVYLKPWLTPAS